MCFSVYGVDPLWFGCIACRLCYIFPPKESGEKSVNFIKKHQGQVKISLLRASRLATQKASPLGLSCHLLS